MKRHILFFLTLFFILSGKAQTNKTFLLMENTNGLSGQVWFYAGTGNNLQRDKIKENWDKGKYITSAAYTANGWFITMSNCPDYTTQSYNVTKDWPRDWIKEKYNQDYYITSISKSENDWFVVMSKVKSYTGQSYRGASLSDLSKWYDEQRSAGFFLTAALYGNGQWYWVMTKGTNIQTQGYKWANESNFEKTVKEIWDDGKRVHLVEFGNGEYFIPYGLLKGDSQPGQSYKTGTSGISEWISQKWDKGMSVKYIGGGNPSAATYVASNNTASPSTPQRNNNNVVRKYRENLNQYYYNEITEYANGNKIVATYGPCSLCGGSQLCGICHGRGGIVTAGYGTWIPCASCGQSGKCNFCRNTGGYALSGSHLYDANGKEIYVAPVGGGGVPSVTTTSPSNNNRRSNNSGICSSCGGTGVNRTPNSGGSRGSWVAYYNSAGTTCPYCSKVDSHFHDRCSRCNIPSY